MRKLLLIIFLILETVCLGFAITGTPVFVDWVFEPEVSTTAGYNIDSNSFGLTGISKFDLTSNIHAKAHKDFIGEGTMYGFIQIEDLEIRIFVDDATQDYDSQTTSTSDGKSTMSQTKGNAIDISLGTIRGKVFIGPVYMVLSHQDHGEVRIMENSLDDSDLDFTVISYSIIPPYFTGSLQGNVDITAVLDGIQNIGTGLNEDPSGPVNNKSFTNLGAMSVGLAISDLMTIELGASTMFSYTDAIRYQKEGANTESTTDDKYSDYYYNPYSLSLLFALKSLDNSILKFKAAVTDGVDNLPMMVDKNPLTLGIMYGYDILKENITITPKFALEIHLLNRRKISSDGLLALGKSDIDELSVFGSIDPNKVVRTLVMPLEFGMSLNITWPDKGVVADESDHLSYAPNDVKVSDGASIGLTFGMTPTTTFAVGATSYLNAKFALWDSEEEDNPGIIPGIKTSLIVNVNLTLGGPMDLTEIVNDLYREANPSYSGDYVKRLLYISGYRLDVGTGLEFKYLAKFVNPYLGVLWKSFDLTGFDVTITSAASSDGKETTKYYSKFSTDYGKAQTDFYNQHDLRLKLGFEIVTLIANTTLTTEWVSGDLLNQDSNDGGTYTEYDYFRNENTDGVNGGNDIQNTNTATKLGYLSLGVKVRF